VYDCETGRRFLFDLELLSQANTDVGKSKLVTSGLCTIPHLPEFITILRAVNNSQALRGLKMV